MKGEASDGFLSGLIDSGSLHHKRRSAATPRPTSENSRTRLGATMRPVAVAATTGRFRALSPKGAAQARPGQAPTRGGASPSGYGTRWNVPKPQRGRDNPGEGVTPCACAPGGWRVQEFPFQANYRTRSTDLISAQTRRCLRRPTRGRRTGSNGLGTGSRIGRGGDSLQAPRRTRR